MRTITKSLFVLICLLLTSSGYKSQSMSGTVIQPCANNGQISVSVTGLTPPISYTYVQGFFGPTVVHNNINSTSDNLSGIAAYMPSWMNSNIWYVSASDGSNQASASFTIVPPFLDTVQVLPGNCPNNSTVSVVNFVGGTAPFTSTWLNTITNNVYNGNPAMVPNGIYSVVTTDAAGCKLSSGTGSSTIWVQGVSGITLNINTTAANCTNGSATVNVTGGNPPFTYLWHNSLTGPTLSGLMSMPLSCTVTDSQGCTEVGYSFLPQAVTINYNSTVTDATCAQSNGAITSFVTGGTTPYTFLWSNTASTQNLVNVPKGAYYVQITDANGCKGTGGDYVNSTTPIIVTYTSTASSCLSATGSATVTPSGGQSPYTVTWQNWPSNIMGLTISNKFSGNYSFQVSDANGCVQNGSAYIPPSSSLFGYVSATPPVCPATTGNLVAGASGSNPPFTYLWSTSATTSSLANMPLGAYSCTITDASGCSVVKAASLIQVSPVSVIVTATAASCLYSANGALAAASSGGTGPYSYSWSNSQNGSSITGLIPGYYTVQSSDANGCQGSTQAQVTNSGSSNSCYCTITGTVYVDANNNCVRNTGEAGVPNIMIHCSGFGYAYTNSNGVYSFMVPTGTYTITETVQQTYPLASCQANNQVVNVTAGVNCVNTVDFANNMAIISDLHVINTNANFAVPGNNYSQYIIVQNEGTVTESTVKFGYTHDGQLNFSSCAPWTLTQLNSGNAPNWYSITSGFPALSPGGSSASYITYGVPTNIPLNTVVNFKDTMARTAPISTSWLNDNTPWNNVGQLNPVVVSSYDPNFKEVSPAGFGAQGNISPNDTVLTYVVHFQNTGSYYAQNIRVVDSLDGDFRISSLKPGYSSHNYVTRVTESGVITFDFPNIYLPWKSQYGDVLSSGLFTYSIRLKKGLPIGTKLTNKAAIYFDYNDPIITNTTLNTIALPTALAEISSIGKNDMLLFPNPAAGTFNIVVNSLQDSRATISVLDVSGRTMSYKVFDLKAGENVLSENTELLQSGIYIVELKSDEVNLGKKLVISK